MTDKKTLPTVVIIGAGITGAALALYLSRRGYNVQLYESRAHAGRSTKTTISLDLSERALFALSEIGIDLKASMAPLLLRVFRYGARSITARYGRYPQECIYSIERRVLCEKLLSAIKNSSQTIELFSQHRLTDIDPGKRELVFLTPQGILKKKYQIVIGCDGIHSKVREIIGRYTNTQVSPVDSGIDYAEFRLPGAPSKKDAYSSCFWPEVNHALVTHPIHAENALSCTLLGRKNFDRARAFQHNRTSFDVPPLPQPQSSLRSVFSENWSTHGNVLIMGDAAHAMLPFIGQGVNCCLEDCTRLNSYLNDHQDRWEKVIPIFEEERRANTKAASEMSSQGASGVFYDDERQLEADFHAKMLEQKLIKKAESLIPFSYFLRFTRIPYSEIYELKEIQDKILQRIRQSNFDLRISKARAELRDYEEYQKSWLTKNEHLCDSKVPLNI